ncbi:hypothetical protein CJU90_5319 [Yarrowia sp. C11]|nr:hypothetical protein CJU90_5319 [Yarrowia sp. C11]KAG5363922.1 hypothetical protein CKK34_2697 [Yarrowia sp. E02]
MDMLHNFSVPQLDHQDYGRDLLTAEDHHNLSHLQDLGHHMSPTHNLSADSAAHHHSLSADAAAHQLSPSHNLSADKTHQLSPGHNMSADTASHNLSADWQSPTYSYTTSTPEDSPGVDDLSLGYEFDLVSPTYVTPTLSALISPVRGGFYKNNQVTQSVGNLSSAHNLPLTQQHSQHSQQLTQHAPPQPLYSSANMFDKSSCYASRSNSTGQIGQYNSSPSSSTTPLTPPQSTLYSQPSYSTPSLTDYITFEYSKNRTKTQYKILSHIHTVNTSDLSAEFKKDNCIYPRAAVPKEEYQGNRHQYETECNHIGWSLAHLNPCIRKKRGVIQRAVDSWRNTNPNPKFRSRRVRKLSKKTQQAAQAAAQQQHQQLLQQQRMVYVPYDYTYRQ